MIFRVAYITHTGNIRKNNEDSLLVQIKVFNKTSLDAPQEQSLEADQAWFVVADGMGGEEAGEDASGEVLQFLAGRMSGLKKAEDLVILLEASKKHLDTIAAQKKIRLGTTAAGLILSPTENYVFNVGDCRVYKVSGGFLNRLTRDHSLLEEASAGGASHLQVAKNVVTSAIMGGDSDKMQVYTRSVPARAGDRFLVCSDGLWGALSVEEMEAAFALPTIQATANALLQNALPKSEDNISFIVVQIG